MTDTPPVVYIVHWRHPVYGDRYTVAQDDRAVLPILTFGSELEARRAAKRYGWRVEMGDPFQAAE